jgi:hypothetical protein
MSVVISVVAITTKRMRFGGHGAQQVGAMSDLLADQDTPPPAAQ